MSTVLRLARLAAAAAVLAAVAWRLGPGPFVDGVRAVDMRALLAASVIGVLTTSCCAWRWTIVARGLGVRLSLPAAVAAYYRSVFLNLTLPGGVAGDLHRGITHGRAVRDVGRGLRAVAWERCAGQAVQALLTLAALLVLPSPVRSWMPIVAVGLAAAIACVVLVLLVDRLRVWGGWWAHARRAVAADVRAGLLHRRALPVIVLASTVVVFGHAITFLIAARTAGVAAPASRLLPLALLALLAMVLPSVAGWGPREGATAWVFASAGLGADRGAATAVTYGVMVLVAALPGALVLVAGRLPRQEHVPAAARVKEAVDA
ncbi:MAG TPA: lysylphosphatidylglycerol synthase transmembrane domain-containing protein [Gaiellaceae bacterium]|nr:lysylphosphatidylglycerol synthase transmembrane domain-containing protein [Gaiellaceae bacterium]